MLVQVGEELLDCVECPYCGVTVLAENRGATGFLAPCGRRLINILQCGERAGCPPPYRYRYKYERSEK